MGKNHSYSETRVRHTAQEQRRIAEERRRASLVQGGTAMLTKTLRPNAREMVDIFASVGVQRRPSFE